MQRYRLPWHWAPYLARAGLRMALVGSMLPVLVAGCDGGGNADERNPLANADWVCNEGSDCSCDALKPGWEIGSSNPTVVSCATYGCCLLTEQETESSFASCECLNTSVSCEAEASTRRNVSVVERCPPGSALPPCAAAGENCRPEYLRQNELSGCCAGLSCRPNEAGVPTCQP